MSVDVVNFSYEHAFERCGVPEEFRTNEHYFFERDPKTGEPFPIPREFIYDKEVYKLRENGAAIARSAHVEDYTELEPGVFIEPEARIWAKRIGHQTIVGAYCHVQAGSIIGPRNIIGENVVIQRESTTEADVEISQGATIYSYVKIGAGSRVDAKTAVKAGAQIRPNTLVFNRDKFKRARKSDY